MVVVIKYGDGELVLSQVFPNVFHWIEFWRIGRQGQKGNVVWRFQIGGGVVSSAVEGEDGVRPACDFFADLSQMKGKCFGVGARQDESSGGAPCRTNRPEDIGPFVALIARRGKIAFLEALGYRDREAGATIATPATALSNWSRRITAGGIGTAVPTGACCPSPAWIAILVAAAGVMLNAVLVALNSGQKESCCKRPNQPLRAK